MYNKKTKEGVLLSKADLYFSPYRYKIPDHKGKINIAAGDINNNDIDDLVVSYPDDYQSANNYIGKVEIFYGQEKQGINSFDPIKLISPNEVKSQFGQSITVAKLSSNLYCDLIVGQGNVPSDLVNNKGLGRIYIYKGPSIFSSSTPKELWGPYGYHIGKAVALAGYVNNDNYRDIITSGEGDVIIFYGSASGFSSDSYKIIEEGNDQSAFSIAGGGDVNGDGYDDIAISDPNSDYGIVKVYLGKPDGIEDDPWLIYNPNPIQHPDELKGFGFQVAMEDVNRDGISDIIVTDIYVGISNTEQTGAVYIFYGKKSNIYFFEVPTYNVVYGTQKWDRIGKSLTVGDFDGDGLIDIATGNGDTRGGDNVHRGIVAIYKGTSESITKEPIRELVGRDYDGPNIGMNLVSGDFDKDGNDELISTGHDRNWKYYIFGPINRPRITDSINLGSNLIYFNNVHQGLFDKITIMTELNQWITSTNPNGKENIEIPISISNSNNNPSDALISLELVVDKGYEYGMTPLSPDTDTDNWSDYWELQHNTNPLISLPDLAIESLIAYQDYIDVTIKNIGKRDFGRAKIIIYEGNPQHTYGIPLELSTQNKMDTDISLPDFYGDEIRTFSIGFATNLKPGSHSIFARVVSTGTEISEDNNVMGVQLFITGTTEHGISISDLDILLPNKTPTDDGDVPFTINVRVWNINLISSRYVHLYDIYFDPSKQQNAETSVIDLDSQSVQQSSFQNQDNLLLQFDISRDNFQAGYHTYCVKYAKTEGETQLKTEFTEYISTSICQAVSSDMYITQDGKSDFTVNPQDTFVVKNPSKKDTYVIISKVLNLGDCTESSFSYNIRERIGFNSNEETATFKTLLGKNKSVWVEKEINHFETVGTYIIDAKIIYNNDWNIFNNKISQSQIIGSFNHAKEYQAGDFLFTQERGKDSDDGAHISKEYHQYNEEEWWFVTGHLKAQKVTQDGSNDEYEFGIMACYFMNPKVFILLLTDIRTNPMDSKFYKYVTSANNQDVSISDTELDLKYLTSLGTIGGNPEIYYQRLYRLDEQPVNDFWTLALDVNGYDNNKQTKFGGQLTFGGEKSPLLIDGDGKRTMGWADPSSETQYSYYYSTVDNQIVSGANFIKRDFGEGNPVEYSIDNSFIFINDEKYEIKSGVLWLDRQWGAWDSVILNAGKNYNGYDWLAINFNNDFFMNMYNMHQKYSGRQDVQSTYSVGNTHTFTSYNGAVIPRALWTNAAGSADYPIHLIYKDPSMNTYFEIDAVMNDQEVKLNAADVTLQGFQFWEGYCTASGFYNGEKVSGSAVLEVPQFGRIFEIV